MEQSASSEPPQEAPAPLADLKSFREEKGISLTDIFQATRISVVNLEAIEGGNFKHLPSPVIARSFIKNYAKFLGISPKVLLDRYERSLEETVTAEQVITKKPEPPPISFPSNRKLLLFILPVLIITVLTAAVAVWIYQSSKEAPALPKTAEVKKPAVAVPPTQEVTPLPPPGTVAPPASPQGIQPPATPPATPAASPAQPAKVTPTAPIHLVVSARELTWIRMTEDRNPAYQILLKPGEKLERQAAEFFDLDIGNAGGVDVTFQGKPLGSLGKKSQVIHLRLP